ncbi:hypothetical protein M493_03020 [Geobacillus genomosp. 3]|uniref:Uncharacterized protein n=1 Tax=Geobacillus genomosp. 3 TaxID=1921421 RepID=S5Z1R7_GEOG3|nr:hypothetical protein M493_03020 [Geobacillus genomosp. 3]
MLYGFALLALLMATVLGGAHIAVNAKNRRKSSDRKK